MLHRSVTETRRLPRGRARVSRTMSNRLSGRIDPRGGTVDAVLFLPDGQAPLHLFDAMTAGGERLGPVRCRSGNRDARLTRRYAPQAMSQGCSRGGPALLHLAENPLELGVRHRLVRRVLDRRHGALLPGAHGAEEHTRSPALRAAHLGQNVVERDGTVPEVVHFRPSVRRSVRPTTHPPATGGSSATSSPSCT